MQLVARRFILALASSGVLLLRPLRVPAEEPLGVRVATGAALLERMSANWGELTTQCNYAEADRTMMQNKTLLLEKASVKGAYQKDPSVVVNMVRSFGFVECVLSELATTIPNKAEH